MAALFSALLPCGTTIVTTTPWRRPAWASDSLWLPVLIPFGAAPSRARRPTWIRLPRTSKALAGAWFSCLAHTAVPTRSASSGQACCRVPGERRCASARAA